MYCINITPRKTWGLLVKYGYFFQKFKNICTPKRPNTTVRSCSLSSNGIFAILMIHKEDAYQFLSVFIVDKNNFIYCTLF